jgi:hypothetical protein
LNKIFLLVNLSRIAHYALREENLSFKNNYVA